MGILLRLLLLFSVACAFVPVALGAGKVTGTIEAPVAKHKANAVVFVKAGDKGPATPKTVQMDQNGLIFVPRVLPIRQGWTVEYINSDPVGHSVFTMDGETYDLGTWPKGERRSYTFQKAGTYRQLCKVHDDMIAYVVVLDTARFGLSDKNGVFSIDGLPPGEYTLGVWHEKLVGSDVQVTVPASGAADVTIPLRAK